MALGNVTFTEVDGQLGIVNLGELPLAIAGLASKGAYTPREFSRLDDVIAEYESGDLVESAAVQLKDYAESGAVILCRINAAAAGTATIVTTSWGASTSVATVRAAGLAPSETNEYRIKFPKGGTRGTDGIEYLISYDAGRTYGVKKALGVATSITLDPTKAGTLVVEFAAGNIIDNVELIIRTVAPVPTTAEVQAAVNALGKHSSDWDCLEVSCPITPAIAGILDTEIRGMRVLEYERYWQGNFRLPTPGETLAAYTTSITTEWSSYSTTLGIVWPADCHFVSRVDGRKCRRPRVWATCPYIERLPRDADAAEIDHGSIPGMSLTDDKGNPELHDERVNPGYDDLKFSTLYSRKKDGVFIGNARIKSPDGSDYKYSQHRRVMNAGKRALRSYLSHVLNKGVMASTKTGLMLPSYLRRIKTMAESAVGSVLGVGPMVSGFAVNPDGSVPIITTENLPVDFEIVPKGYFKSISVRVLFRNPAYQAAA